VGGSVGWIVNIAGPWLVLAFVVGALAPDARAAVVGSVVTLVAAVLAKYALQLGQHDISVAHAGERTLAWGVAAILVSVAFASAGQRIRSRRWPLLLLAAALAIEALGFLVGPLRGESAHLRYHGQPAAVAVFAGELALACALAAVAATAGRLSR
jgi:hypothetical protein